MPDILILNAGATPRMAQVHRQNWKDFSANWNTDVKSSFNFGTAALSRPMPANGVVITISSGAAISGSYASGGYAGAKRTQWFLNDYFQREAKELGLDLRFLAVLPKQQFRETRLGQTASAGYAERIGISQEAFLARFKNALSPDGFADKVWAAVGDPDLSDASAIAISGAGIERLE